jgi:hypothetical protein
MVMRRREFREFLGRSAASGKRSQELSERFERGFGRLVEVIDDMRDQVEVHTKALLSVLERLDGKGGAATA